MDKIRSQVGGYYHYCIEVFLLQLLVPEVETGMMICFEVFLLHLLVP
jgi:hypothetical protein